MSNTTFNEELKKTLYTKLHCLRLEVHASIVDDIKKTVDELFTTPTSPKEVKSAEEIFIRNYKNNHPFGHEIDEESIRHIEAFDVAIDSIIEYASQLHPVSKSEGEGLYRWSPVSVSHKPTIKTLYRQAGTEVILSFNMAKDWIEDGYLHNLEFLEPVSKDALTEAVEVKVCVDCGSDKDIRKWESGANYQCHKCYKDDKYFEDEYR